jgi:phosphoglycerol transferase MdoB-like AlkP superfamily enzyme
MQDSLSSQSGVFLESKAAPYEWRHACALSLCALGTSLVINSAWLSMSITASLSKFLIGALSMLPVLLLGALSIFRGKIGLALRATAVFASFVMMIWYVASLDFFIEQGRHLSYTELMYRLQDPASLEIGWGFIATWRLVKFTAVYSAAYTTAYFICRRLPPRQGMLAFSGAMLFVLVGGTTVHLAKDALKLNVLAVQTNSAPWSPVQNAARTDLKFNFQAAKEYRDNLSEPFWSDSSDPFLTPLAGRYAGRSVVLIVLESHRASDIAGLGEGAWEHQPCSPYLTELLKEAVVFENYYASGTLTGSATWSIFTGLPGDSEYPFPVHRYPEASTVGCLPRFMARGYAVDGICAAPPAFDQWDRLLGSVGARWWIENQEQEGLSREYWGPFRNPDEQIFQIALARYLKSTSQKKPYLQIVLSTSNHPPFAYPQKIGKHEFPADHIGGMRYADYSMEQYIEGIKVLPESQRPIVFITADTSHASRLAERERGGLERWRIPGVLLLPDQYAAGTRLSTLIGHEDVLDLLYLLVEGDKARLGKKFMLRQRQVLSAFGGSVIFSAKHVFYDQKYLYSINGLWNMADSRESAPLIHNAVSTYTEDMKKLWQK